MKVRLRQLTFYCIAVLAFSLIQPRKTFAQPQPEKEEINQTVLKFLDQLQGDWEGQISIIRPQKWRKEINIQIHVNNTPSATGGFILWQPEEGDPVKETFQILPDSTQRSSTADFSLFPEIGFDYQGKPDTSAILLSDLHPNSPHFINLTFIGETRMDMQLTGQWTLPENIYKQLQITDRYSNLRTLPGEPMYHLNGQLRKNGFRLKIGPFELVIMEFVGIFATLFFASRFVIQWIASERAKRSVMPELFWWVSLIGSGLMLIYAIYFGRLAVLLGQLTGWTVYVRNIWLIEREKRQRRLETNQEE